MTSNQLRSAVAKNIHNRRVELGITQTALAASVGVTSARISQIESSVGAVPLDLLAKIAEALGTTPAAVVDPSHFSRIPEKVA